MVSAPGRPGYSCTVLLLQRTVRFGVDADEAPRGVLAGENGFGGVPAMRGLGRHYELVITCRGEPDPVTGYLINIKRIDEAARSTVVPRIARACRETPGTEPAELLPELARLLAAELPSAERLAWRLSPTFSAEIFMNEPTHALIRQQFDFAAAHRLHVPTLSDQQNRELFGKCNNPRGHGHNYRVETAVRMRAGAGERFSLADIERATQETVIDRFDHKHLNEDTREFAAPGGLNPSVENIAKVCYDLLVPAISERSRGEASLASITVWETDRTSATYPG
jgi:6-pyruvoyltetrahydropterin/6-carboxytetrahydropterin synthase